MKDCGYFETQISTYADGMLSQEEAEELQAHLAQCPECRALFASFREMSEAFSSLETAPPAGFSEEVLAAVKARSVHAKRKRRYITSIAAALLVLLMGLCSLQAVKCFSNAHKSASGAADMADAEAPQSGLEVYDAQEEEVAEGSVVEKASVLGKSEAAQSLYRIDSALADPAEVAADETGETDDAPALYFAVLTIRGEGADAVLTRAEADALLARLDTMQTPYRYETDGPEVSADAELCLVRYAADLPQDADS